MRLSCGCVLLLQLIPQQLLNIWLEDFYLFVLILADCRVTLEQIKDKCFITAELQVSDTSGPSGVIDKINLALIVGEKKEASGPERSRCLHACVISVTASVH